MIYYLNEIIISCLGGLGMNWVLWHWASLFLRFTVSRSSSTRAQECFWLLYTTVQLVQKRTVTSTALFVILLCSATSQGRKQRRMILNEKKIKPAVCDLRLNGLISAMSASCSLPLSLAYWKWVLQSVQPSHYCIILITFAFVFGSKRTGCASILDVKWNKARTRGHV